MHASLKRNYDYIYNFERLIGHSVALMVLQSKSVGVWEFLIPIIFILHYMRNKQSREVFIQNYLFTKRHALDAAYKILNEGPSREDVLASIEAETRSLLSTPGTRKIYSESIRRRQIAEIDLLLDHYSRLLKAQGTDYGALVRNAYGSRQAYAEFHEKLVSAERKVSDAARETMGQEADETVLLRIERATENIRQAQIAKIFEP